MRVKVRLFARLRDIAGATELDWEVAGPATIADVWRSLVAAHPALAEYGSSLSCARNEDYARKDAPVADGDEIAFLPPVSGGDRDDRLWALGFGLWRAASNERRKRQTCRTSSRS
jgi:molybdopterin converting factor subunit 1